MNKEILSDCVKMKMDSHGGINFGVGRVFEHGNIKYEFCGWVDEYPGWGWVKRVRGEKMIECNFQRRLYYKSSWDKAEEPTVCTLKGGKPDDLCDEEDCRFVDISSNIKMKKLLKWKCEIEKADNGYILRHEEETTDGEAVTERVEVFEGYFESFDQEFPDEERGALTKLLYAIADYFGYDHNSFAKDNLRISWDWKGRKVVEEDSNEYYSPEQKKALERKGLLVVNKAAEED